MIVLIIGLGSIAKKHIRVLRSIYPSLNLLALRSNSPAENVEGVVNIFDWKEVLLPPDFILISNPTKFHKDAIHEALRLGCPLFIEKPVVSTLQEVAELMNETDIQSRMTYVACNLRFHPCLIYLRNLILQQRNKINEVNVYCGSDLSKWRPKQDYTKSYSASKELGGGVHLDLIHEIDYCYWLFGNPYDVITIKRKVSHLKIDSNDFAVYHLLYPEFTINITLNYYRQDARRAIELVMEDGTLYVDLIGADILKDGQHIYKAEGFKMENTYLSQMEYFVDHIQKRKPLMNDFTEAVEVLKIATAPDALTR